MAADHLCYWCEFLLHDCFERHTISVFCSSDTINFWFIKKRRIKSKRYESYSSIYQYAELKSGQRKYCRNCDCDLCRWARSSFLDSYFWPFDHEYSIFGSVCQLFVWHESKSWKLRGTDGLFK